MDNATDMTEQQAERRLAAILAADVVGYSRLVSADESGTLARLNVLRRETIEPAIAKHAGRLFKTMGDGFLVEFASAVQAVGCAIAIQQQSEAAAAGLDDAQKMRLRIGIHVGDVLVDGDDLMGDGVNIAARLEGIAAVGGLSISRAVHDQVRDRLEVGFEDRGEIALKNITRPVQVFALAATATARNTGPEPRGALALPDKPSIAVLPFQNMSADPEQDYFADGMVEDITTALSRAKWLFVISRNSAFAYKGKAIDIKRVGRELGVRYVLEGSVRKAGNRVRITGQLIEVATNAHLWADRFDGALEDIFDLQDKITSSIVGAISPKLEAAEIALARNKPTAHLGAYDYYLRGMALFYEFTKEGHQQAIAQLRKAVELDPDFALAQAAITGWYVSSKAFAWVKPGPEEIADVDRLARRLLKMSNDDARVLAFAGQALVYIVGNLREGAPVLEQAIGLDPNLAVARFWGGGAKLFLGELDAAIAHFEIAMRLSPLDPRIFLAHLGLSNAHFLAGRYDQACEDATTGLRQWPNYLQLQRSAAAGHAMAGRIDEARRFWRIAYQLDPSQSISGLRRTTLFRPDDFEKFAAAYRMMGMPE